MRAIVITGAGGPDVLESQRRETPEPGVGQVRVRVRASGLNRADLMQREGHYPAPSGAPADIPGIEYAGEVDALGPGVTRWRAGDRVMGLVAGGAHAEQLCVHEREAIAIPAALSFDEAAAIPEAFLTAYDALAARAGVQLGEVVLVHAAASGVGTAAIQLASVAGATVIGTSRSAAKLERVRALGVTHAVHAEGDDWPERVEAAVGANAVHVVIDLVGGAYLAGNLRVLATLGRLVLIGLTAGRRAPLDMGVVLAKRATVVGTVLRARPLEEKIALAREFESRVVPLFERGALRPVVDRVLPFSEVRGAHEALARNDTVGKIVLRWD